MWVGYLLLVWEAEVVETMMEASTVSTAMKLNRTALLLGKFLNCSIFDIDVQY